MKRWISMLMICALATGGCTAQAGENWPGEEGAPESYAAVEKVDGDGELSGSIISVGAGESAVCATAGALLLRDASIVRSCDADADVARLYGVGAAVLAAGGAIAIRDSAVDTDALGAAGLFACGNGSVDATDVSINTLQRDSAGICASLEGSLRAETLNVTTGGANSPALCSLRGGSISVQGGSYAADGADSPALRAASQIVASDAQFSAGACEAVLLEEGGNVRLDNCRLDSGAAEDQRGDSCAVLLHAGGGGRFEMCGGALNALCGDVFRIEGGAAEIILAGADVTAAENARLLICTGGAAGRFTAIGQSLAGDAIWSGASALDLYLCEGSSFTGAVYPNEEAGAGGYCSLYIDESSTWTVTGDSALTNLSCAGTIVDDMGRSVSVIGTDGAVYLQGESAYTVTVDRFQDVCDMSGAGRLTAAQEGVSAGATRL